LRGWDDLPSARLGLPGSRRCGAAASLAPSGRKPYGAAAAAHGSPATDRARAPVATTPVSRDTSQGQAVSVAPCAPVALWKITGAGPERRALSGSAPPASTVLRVRATRGRACGALLTLETSADPAGLDGEGQARGQAHKARG